MTDFIYIETGVRDHPRSRQILQRFAHATTIEIERYGEVFNRKAQHFRLQKRSPALILARKHTQRLLPTPAGYGLGGAHHYYFSHMLNCLYDCRYCFLQGMYHSAHYVLFVNYEEFFDDIAATLQSHPGQTVWFFSGYDCDSLAYDPVSGFMDSVLPFFAQHPRAQLELRTKSTQIRSLLQSEPLANVVVAFSFTPQTLSDVLEPGVPSVAKRIDAMSKLHQQGWRIGLRFDPLLHTADFIEHYRALFEQIFARLAADAIHSISLGAFRLPLSYATKLQRLHPDSRLLAGEFSRRGGMLSYPEPTEHAMLEFCREELRRHAPRARFFACTPWNSCDLEPA